jgi:GWxTD domain-containing protein
MKRTASTLPAMLVALLLLGGAAGIARAQLEPMEQRREEAPFELSLSQEFNEQSQPILVVSTSIPYRWLVFLVRGNDYEARYRVYLSLTDRRGKSVRGEVWEETVVTNNFKDTGSTVLASISRKTFPITPGEYHAEVTIEVIDTSRRFTKEADVRIVGEGQGMLGISAPVFYTVPLDSVSKPPGGRLGISRCAPDELKTLRINPGAIYGDFQSAARIAFTIAVPSASAEKHPWLAARIRDSQGRLFLYSRAPLGEIEAGHVTMCVDLNVDAFSLGVYEIDAVVMGSGEGDLARRSTQAAFTVLLNKSLLGAHFADLVGIISPIATPAQLEAFKKTPPGERYAAWVAFWKKRNPNPSASSNEAYEEYLSRLRVVIKSFSKFRPGWQSDMGKIYLRLGPPDKVEDRQNVSIGTNWQLWYYNSKGTVYIFEDTTGNGDYHLYTTEMM